MRVVQKVLRLCLYLKNELVHSVQKETHKFILVLKYIKRNTFVKKLFY